MIDPRSLSPIIIWPSIRNCTQILFMPNVNKRKVRHKCDKGCFVRTGDNGTIKLIKNITNAIESTTYNKKTLRKKIIVQIRKKALQSEATFGEYIWTMFKNKLLKPTRRLKTLPLGSKRKRINLPEKLCENKTATPTDLPVPKDQKHFPFHNFSNCWAHFFAGKK